MIPERRAGAIVLLLLGLVGILALVYQFTLIYFTFGEVPETTTGEKARYFVTTGLTLASFIGCSALAAGRSDAVVRCGVGGFLLALLVAAVFSVPEGRWRPGPPERQELPSNYSPCLSGSGQCDMAG